MSVSCNDLIVRERKGLKMPKVSSTAAIDTVVRRVIAPAADRAASDIARFIAEAVAAELEVALTKRGFVGTPQRIRRAATRRHPKTQMTKWVADSRARRVPTFVIQATGLNTKKKIVAKYGESAAFEKGKPLPAARASAPAAAVKLKPKVVKAKAPTLRKAGGTK